MTMIIDKTLATFRTYEELMSLDSFDKRFEYCRIPGHVGLEKFGSHRIVNQDLYSSDEWKAYRNHIIVRDLGRDLAMPGFELKYGIVIHHLNPLTFDDFLNNREKIFDDNNVVCVSDRVHKAIHYGTLESIKTGMVVERRPGDTTLW